MAAKTIGFAVVLDGLDGRIARMTNTTSEFGRELDSLADIISFGIAPAVLAYTWGVQFVGLSLGARRWIICSARASCWRFFSGMRAARSGAVQRAEKSAAEKSGCAASQIFCGTADTGGGGDGRSGGVFIRQLSDHQFHSSRGVAAAAVAAFVPDGEHVALLEFQGPQPFDAASPLLLVVMGTIIFAIWNWSQPVLLILGSTYVASGITIRAGGIVRRYFRPTPKINPETQVG